ncbi:MAG TPA: dihydrodipicolinate reductase [Planctomycetota bacterium]|nr:dihydrodipicolinate reductase [Planctomycetota bacterium]
MRVLHVGLGPLGARVQADLAARTDLRAVAAVDVDPALLGRTLAELAEGAPADVRVAGDLDGIDFESVDVALVTTSSDLERCAGTLRALLERGVSVVSSCEELLWPWLRHPELADELDRLARRHGAALLGTGVNPGFVMDALPAFLSAAALSVDAVRVARIQDASTRRVPFQQKIGAGLDLATFRARAAEGTLRHVGLGESLHFLAAALGWTIEDWSETLEPVLAERDLECVLGPIRAGAPCGVRQTARARVAGRERMHFEFVAAIGQSEPRDRVLLDSDPPLELVIPGGVHGDRATSAVLLHCLAPLAEAAPGLTTMAGLRMPTCRRAPA